jgi:uncharacterized protein involved in exopolysaccharide biosynthesis
VLGTAHQAPPRDDRGNILSNGGQTVNNESVQWAQQDQAIDARALLARFWAGRRWILVSTALFTVLFAAAAFIMTPVYRASVVMVSADRDRNLLSGSLASALGNFGGLASIAGINLGESGAGKEEALAVLKSREFTERFIKDLGLMPVLFPKQWDAASKRWRGDEAKWPTPSRAYRAFDDIRTISQDKKTGLVTLRIDWRDRKQAAEWANELVRRLNTEMRSRAIVTADASLGYLAKELQRTEIVSAREAINRLVEAQIRERMLANVTQEFSFRVVDRAMVPDRDEKLRPKRLLMTVAGFAIGVAAGAFAVLLFTGAASNGRASRGIA